MVQTPLDMPPSMHPKSCHSWTSREHRRYNLLDTSVNGERGICPRKLFEQSVFDHKLPAVCKLRTRSHPLSHIAITIERRQACRLIVWCKYVHAHCSSQPRLQNYFISSPFDSLDRQRRRTLACRMHQLPLASTSLPP